MYCRTIAGLVLLSLLCCSPGAAQEPSYYPAYGAWRGKIINRSGPFGYRQKVRWGGGLTEAGAGVLTSAIQAAGPIVSTFAGRELEGESEAERSLREADFQRSMGQDQQLLQEAEALLARTRALYVAFGGQAAVAPVTGPATKPATVPGVDTFQDWPTNGVPPPVPAAPGTAAPPPPGTGMPAAPPTPAAGVPGAVPPGTDDFRDWPTPDSAGGGA